MRFVTSFMVMAVLLLASGTMAGEGTMTEAVKIRLAKDACDNATPEQQAGIVKAISADIEATRQGDSKSPGRRSRMEPPCPSRRGDG